MSSDEIEYDFAFMKTMYYWRSVREANGRSGRPRAAVIDILSSKPEVNTGEISGSQERYYRRLDQVKRIV